MKFGICNEIFKEWNDFSRACEYSKQAGYDGIEIAPFTFKQYVGEITTAERKAIVDQAAAADIEIIGLHWLLAGTEGMHITTNDADVRKKTSDYLVELVDCCGELGGTRMIFGSPYQRNIEEGQTYQEAFDRAKAVFEPMLPKLEEYGIIFCLEQLSSQETNFFQTAEQTVDMIDALDHPNFQLLLDTKAMIDEPLGRAGTIKKYAKYLKHYHANDANLHGPGFGDVDFAPIFDALRDIDFQDYVSVEVFDFEIGPEAIATKSMEYMKKFV